MAEFPDNEVRAATAGAVGVAGQADGSAPAAAIRAGDLDGRADTVMGCLRMLLRHRLTVDHPGYDRD